jgi:hypothetical protein
MKVKITTLIFLCTCHMAFSQWFGTTNSTALTYRGGNVVIGGTSVIGSFSGEGIMQVQGSLGSIMSLRTTSPANSFDAYLGTNAATLNLVNGPMYLSTGYVPRITLLANGTVGIGTNTPGTFKLAVEGKVGAREFHVTSANPWPDYVFDPSYKLRPLSEVSGFISKNRHLPEMPSASEVATIGHSLGEMDALLLKKVEELTLYILQQNAEIQTLKKGLNQLQNNK